MSTETRVNGYGQDHRYGGLVNSEGLLYDMLGRRQDRRADSSPRRPGARLIGAATVLLGLLGAALLIVSITAQYRYMLAERHQSLASGLEAGALDAGMMIFSLLALGLARAGQSARAERVLVVACAAGSALMNLAAADAGSPRSVLAWVAPPVFLAVVVDRVVVVVRRHVLGVREGHSPWSAAGTAALWGLRLLIAAPSTLAGGRRAVLLATPLPPACSGPAAITAAEIAAPKADQGGESPAQDPDGPSAGRHQPPAGGQGTAPGPSKRAQLEAAYEALGAAGDPRYLDRSQVSPVARELAAQVGCEWGSARTVLGRYLAGREDAR
ncbi:MAG TPA: hypothetical protein VMK13_12620 [Streptosporangiaceae bacterium]|nr:hypothetical protein [Streptosporangiaceae bacterium]